MRIFSISKAILPLIFLGLLISCKKETEDFQSEPLNEYVPLEVGKTITYRVDSMIFSNFGRNTEIHKYQERHVVESAITDNEGRPSFRIFRYLSDSAGTAGWTAEGSYYITPSTNQVELIEDNLRIIKIHAPLKDGFSWKGNKYLPVDPYGSAFNFSNDDNMEDWDFRFDGGASSFSYDGHDYTDVYTVEQADEAYNVPIDDPVSYAARSRSVEKYSKNIGLIYREFEMWEYQPNTTGSGGPYKTGFGITMWMIDHN